VLQRRRTLRQISLEPANRRLLVLRRYGQGTLAESVPEAKTGGGEPEPPDVRYTQSGDAAIAYYVLGEDPRDLVFAPFMLSAVFA
jgi:hypothetical protein